MHSVIISIFYKDKHWNQIDEDSEDYENKILEAWVEKIFRFVVDAEKWLYYDFDGKGFWELKIQTENMILWHPAKSNLH